jgi:hypothetical protein
LSDFEKLPCPGHFPPVGQTGLLHSLETLICPLSCFSRIVVSNKHEGLRYNEKKGPEEDEAMGQLEGLHPP